MIVARFVNGIKGCPNLYKYIPVYAVFRRFKFSITFSIFVMQSVVAPIKETNMNPASEEAPLSFARKVCGLRYLRRSRS